ncbi:MAG: 4-(cytidine 5'-diphospho)-2-C-methyl-D-erythritol kinase [Clostridia bacterium]|nr:4-(cytidine 5'-diphospho)-2-C-methyl-D-erythritol kinase [Clostridia bacterium]
MRIPAYAKINLFLDVMEKREDGFHNIKSIMHRVTLCDYLSCEKALGDESFISVTCPKAEIPQGEGNLVWRAAKLFFDTFGITDYKVNFVIEKHIPMAAGLAGGSADAAAALLLLNELYEVNASAEKLCEIGAILGSDVPFCIDGVTSITTGRGEIMEKIDCRPDFIFVVAKGGEGISTPRAYRQIDEMYGDTLSDDFGDLNGAIDAVSAGDAQALAKYAYNTFESVVLPIHSEASAAKKTMLDNGAIFSMLSGSGPSVFGIFNTVEEAERVSAVLKDKGYDSHVCRSL